MQNGSHSQTLVLITIICNKVHEAYQLTAVSWSWSTRQPSLPKDMYKYFFVCDPIWFWTKKLRQRRERDCF